MGKSTAEPVRCSVVNGNFSRLTATNVTSGLKTLFILSSKLQSQCRMYCDGSDVTSDQAGRERGLETMANRFSAPPVTTLLLNANVISKMEKHL